jgi:poly(A) polymerase
MLARQPGMSRPGGDLSDLPKILDLQEMSEREPFLGFLLPYLKDLGLGEIYMVGGYLRDYLLGQTSHDIDFITRADPGLVASEVAVKFDGKYFLLHEEENAFRAIFNEGSRRLTIDFSPIRGQSVEEDISLRDFSINAMAVDVDRLVDEEKLRLPRDLIDKHYGWHDLSRRILRECDNHTFLMDPVRLVRALRFRHTLNMEYEERTLNHMKKYAALILKVPGERVESELMEILMLPGSSRLFAEIEYNPVLQHLFPELIATLGLEQNAYHHLEVWAHSLLTLDELDELLDDPSSAYPDFKDAISAHLREPLQDIQPRYAFLRLAALYHDAGKAQTFSRDEKGRIHFYKHEFESVGSMHDLAGRLRLSRKATDYLARIVEKHMTILLSLQQKPSARHMGRMVQRLGDELVDVVLLSTADRKATRGPLTSGENLKLYTEFCRDLLGEYYKAEAIAPLLRGGDLIAELGLAQGPLIGEILDEVRMAQLEGEVTSREEALELARSLVLARKGSP